MIRYERLIAGRGERDGPIAAQRAAADAVVVPAERAKPKEANE